MSDFALDGVVRLDTSGIDRAMSGIGSSVGRMATVAGAAIAAIGIGDFIADSIKEAREAVAVTKDTEAVLASMGSAANVTAEHVARLAEAISNKSAIDDEAIQKGQNLLLTFGNIRNEVGAGNDIFDQASQVMADFSVRFGKDIPGAAVAVGKALNDPIAGLTSLSRVGVQFTDQQKEQIKTLVESGHTLDAQKVIMGELGRQTAGAAAAAADPWAKFEVVIANLKESFGNTLLPLLNRGIEILNDALPKAVDTVREAFDKVEPTLTKVRDALAPVVTAIGDFIAKNPGPVFAALAVVIGGVLLAAVAALGIALAGIVGAFGSVIAGFTLVVAGIALLVGGIVYAYQHFEIFRTAVNAIGEAFIKVNKDTLDTVREAWPKIQEAIGQVINVISAIFDGATAAWKAVWNLWGDDITRILNGAWTIIKAIFDQALNVITNTFRIFVAVFNGDWDKALKVLHDMMSRTWDNIKNIIGGALDVISGVIGGAYDLLKRAAEKAFNAIKDAITGVVDKMYNIGRDIVQGIIDGISSQIENLKRGVGKIAAALPGPMKDLLGIHSPSQVFADIGRQIPLGLVQGINSGVGLVQAAVNDMVGTPSATSPTMAMGAAGAAGSASGMSVTVNINGVANADDVRGAIPELVRALQAGVGAR
jgi:phage-related protein